MRIMGLDLSLSGAGCAVLDDHETVLRAFSASTGPQDGSDIERSDYIATILAETYLHYAPQVVWVENYAFSRTTVSRLAELGGIVKLRLWEWGGYDPDELRYVTSNTVKLAIAGHGNASKKEMVAAVRPHIEHLGLTPKQLKDNNIADAVGIALYGMRNM